MSLAIQSLCLGFSLSASHKAAGQPHEATIGCTPRIDLRRGHCGSSTPLAGVESGAEADWSNTTPRHAEDFHAEPSCTLTSTFDDDLKVPGVTRALVPSFSYVVRSGRTNNLRGDSKGESPQLLCKIVAGFPRLHNSSTLPFSNRTIPLYPMIENRQSNN